MSRYYKSLSLMTFALLILNACSSTPTTEFYALGRLDAQATSSINVINNATLPVIGLRRVDLPEYLERSNVVSIDDKNRLTISSYHRWAGDLHQQVSRALETYLQQGSSIDVWQSPWDNNVRPQYQLAVQLNRMDGEVGRTVVLEAEWRLYDMQSDAILRSERLTLSVPNSSNRHAAYVEAIDKAVLKFSQAIQPSLAELLRP